MIIFGASSFEITSFGTMAVLVLFLILNLILIARKKSSWIENLNLVVPVIVVVLVAYTFLEIVGSSPLLELSVGGWPPPYGIEVAVNFYNSILLLFAAISMLIVFLSLKTERITHLAHVLFILLFIGVFGMLHTNDLFNLFVYMEVMSIASYGLAAISKERGRYRSALYYAFSSSLASTFFLLGVFIIYTAYGTLNLQEIRIASTHPLPTALFASAMVILAMIFKLAVFPFYLWKTKLMRTTNVPFAFFLGALSPTISFYLLSKLMVDLNLLSMKIFSTFLTVLSGVTGLVVIVMAFRAKNLMEGLAYGSVAQAALALMLLTASVLNGELIVYAMIHQLNMMIFETLIFGSLVLRGGIVKELIELLFSTGVVSSIGVPLTSGFISKYLAIIGFMQASIPVFLLSITLILASAAYGLNAYNLRKEFHYRRSVENKIPHISIVFVFFALTFLLGIWYEPLITAGKMMAHALMVYG